MRGLDSRYLRNSSIAEYFVNENYIFKDSDIIIINIYQIRLKKKLMILSIFFF